MPQKKLSASRRLAWLLLAGGLLLSVAAGLAFEGPGAPPLNLSHPQAWAVVLAGVSLSALLFGFFCGMAITGDGPRQIQGAAQPTEENIRRNERRFHDLINSANGVVWEADAATLSFTFVSEKAEPLFGYPLAEWLVPAFWVNHLHPEDRARVTDGRAALASRLETFDFEYRFIARDGNTVWIRDIGTVLGQDGKPLRLRGLMIDITRTKQLEESLRESEFRWRSAIDGFGDGLWDLNVRDNTLFMSRRWKQMIGYADEEIGDAFDEWATRIHPDDAAEALGQLQRFRAGELPAYLNEHRLRCRNGRWKWFLCRGIAVARDADGKPVRVIGTHFDIADRKESEHRIERAVQQAVAATRAKSEFLAHMSHEIRTPMNAIVGAARLLGDENLTPRQLAYTRIMRHSSQRLMSLIDDILDFSKIEAGHVVLRNDTFSLDAIMEGLAGLAAVSAEGSGIEINFDLAPELPPFLIGDASRLEQVLTNLLSNAIKFAPGGRITLSAERISDGPDKVGILFAVADNGVGIPGEKLDAIFDPFVQAENAITRAHDGTGLGLTISRRLVEMMGGNIEVSSELGRGSRFAFTALFGMPLPAAVGGDPPPAHTSGAFPLAGRRILMVEDNQFNRVVLDGMMQPLEVEVDVAVDGADAIECFQFGPPMTPS